MSEPYQAQIVECPMCGCRVDSDLIIESSGLCCECDPDNRLWIKADYQMDREGDR